MTKKRFMDLTEKKYPIYMDLVQMASILELYNKLDSRIWIEKKRKERLTPVVQEIREIWDNWLMERNKYVQDQIDSGKWKWKNGSKLGEKEE